MEIQQNAAFGSVPLTGGEELIQPLIDALSANVALLTMEGDIFAVNTAWIRFAGSNGSNPETCGIGVNYLDICQKAEAGCPEAKLAAAALLKVVSGEQTSCEISYRLELADGMHHYKQTISRLILPHQDCIAVCHEDVSAVVRLEEQRRSHAIQLLNAQDEERRHIARELHDSTAQHLTTVSLLSQAALLKKERGEEIAPLLEELIDIVGQAQKEIRTFSYLLHTPEVLEIGLEDSLKRYIEGFSKRTGVDVSFDWGSPGKQLGQIDLAVLRIVQEALTNAYRHSGARNAEVSVEFGDDEVRICVSDNGSGSRSAPIKEGVGIPSMRSRVTEIGGTFEIVMDEDGTRVLATFPMQPATTS